jgi:hypothetical protein
MRGAANPARIAAPPIGSSDTNAHGEPIAGIVIHLILAAVLQHWLVVNDIHLDPFSSEGVIYGEDTTRELLTSAVRAMRADVPDARVVILGGDMLAHEFPERAHEAHRNAVSSALETVRTIANELNGAFPSAQFLVAQGNNDDPCGDYRSEVDGPFQERLGRIWQPLVDRGGAAPNFLAEFDRGGYYTTRLPIRNGRAIVLNSVFWSFIYRGGCLSNPHDPGAAELTWLRAALSHFGPGTNGMILMHIPPGYDPLSTSKVHRLLDVPFLSNRNNRAFLDAVTAHASVLRFIAGAHTHRYDFRIVEGVPMLIGSSISPVYDNNPAFFVLDVDADGAVHDVHPFVYDPYLDNWERKPTFDAMYGVTDFSRAALESVAANIQADGADRAAWVEAYPAWSSRPDSISGPWLSFACAQTEMSDGYAACAGTTNRSRKVAIVALGSLALLAILAWLIYRGREPIRSRSR